MNRALIHLIEQALSTVRHYAGFGFWPASSLEPQLMWCLRRANGEMMPSPPSPLDMASVVEREFADYGTYSLLAHQLRTIESSMERLEMESQEYFALSA